MGENIKSARRDVSVYGATLKCPELFPDKINWTVLREIGVLQVSKMTKAPLPGIATSSIASFKKKTTN